VSEEELEFLISGPSEIHDPGYDGRVYLWHVQGKPVQVRFTATAWEVGSEGVSARAEKAIESLGKSEMLEFLNWTEPPDVVEFSTDNYPLVEGGKMANE
jgi:hypothetical protein